MQNNRTLVFGNLYGIPNTWERKYKEDVNTHKVIVNNEAVILKENFNTYLLQTNILYDNSYLEYFIFPTTESRKKIRDILKTEDLALCDKQFYFNCRIETFRNPPYLHFKNAILIDDEELDQYDQSMLYTSMIDCEVFKHNYVDDDEAYNFMLVKTINEEGYNNPLKIHYKDAKYSKLKGQQQIKVKIENNKVIMLE